MDDDSIPGLRFGRKRPGCVTVVLLSAVTSAVVAAATIAALSRYEVPWLTAPSPTPDDGEVAAVVAVPDLLGVEQSAAGAQLEEVGLRLAVDEERTDPAVEAGAIAEQSPRADTQVVEGTEVHVVVSTGTASIAVPDLVGRPVEAAREALTEAGLSVGEVTEGGEGDAGTVTATDPAAGAQLPADGAVALTVAPSGVLVPDVTGVHARIARTQLEEAGFVVGTVRQRYDDSSGAYVVLSQEPAGDTRAEAGATVNLVSNQGY